jgi:hypothetical protein
MAIDEKSMQRMLDDMEIRNLLARIHNTRDAVRRGEATEDDYNANWTTDGIWESATMGRWAGHTGHQDRTEQVNDLVRAGGANLPDLGDPDLGSYHMTVNTEVNVDGDVATCYSKFIFGTTRGTAGEINMCGRYVDEVRRTPDGWKMHHRRVFP